MKVFLPLSLACALAVAAQAQADCVYPRAPDAPPDGNTATKEQMIAAKHDFDRYNGEMNTYLDCIKLESDSVMPKDASKMSADDKKKAAEQQKLLAAKNNAAVDELQANVGKFNEQLKAFKAKQSQAKP